MCALFGEFASVGKREYLKSTAVGEYRSVPSVEFVQTSGLPYNLRTRTQIQMVGVTEYYLCFYVIAELVLVHTFHTAEGTHRHEYRGEYLAVVGGYLAGACVAALSCGL